MMPRPAFRALYYLIPLVFLLLAWEVSTMARDDWAEKWCELNDCFGVQEAEQRSVAQEKYEKEIRKATRRYQTTGEVKAIRSEAVQGAYFGYDGPVLDHPAFPGVAQEHAQRAERKHEAFAVEQRKTAQRRAISPPEPTEGYLLPSSSEATQLAVREQEETGVAMARRRHQIMTEEVRIGCMFEYGQDSDGKGGYTLGGKITTIQAPVKGCAAGSVWSDDGRGGVFLASRTAESAGSVWRKVNGTDREWFETVNRAPKGVPWVQSQKEIRAAQLLPYKLKAPPPCAPGYGGAFCKIELGTGADYVDEEDEPPPWGMPADVARLKGFWKEQHALSVGASLPGVDMSKHKQGSALPLVPGEFTAGTASSKDWKDDTCTCDPEDLKCIQKCTYSLMSVPKQCYQKCDSSGCHEECVHVEMKFDDPKKSKGEPKKKKDDDPAALPKGKAPDAIGSSEAKKEGEEEEEEGKEAAGVQLCPAGSFSATGQLPCAECPAGTYMRREGAKTCVRCEPGSFQNSTGATACEECSEGGGTVKAGSVSVADCGEHAVVTGLQAIPYEMKMDDDVIVEGGSDDGSFAPTLTGGAAGAWHGGWWMAVYGRNLGKSHGDLLEILVGDHVCRRSVWLSATSSACMVPRGMGAGLPVTVGLRKDSATVEGKFTYEPPVVQSYHPRNGAPRGGFWVTITGQHFGHVDTSPTAYLAGRVCLESYWMSNTQVLCRGPPGVGGPTMLHHVDVRFEPAEHVQDMPRRLRSWVRSILASRIQTVSSHQDTKPLVEIDVKAANTESSITSKALAKSARTAEAGEGGQELSTLMDKWEEREAALKAELAKAEEQRPREEEEKMVSYLEVVEERDLKREEEERKARENRMAEYKAIQEEELQTRREEAARLAQQEKAKVEREKSVQEGTDKKLEKFRKAQEQAKKKKAAVEAKKLLTQITDCTNLVEMVCKSGHCSLETGAALASPLCSVQRLETLANVTEEADMREEEDAKKAVALLFEIRAALREGREQVNLANAALDRVMNAGKPGSSKPAAKNQKPQPGLGMTAEEVEGAAEEAKAALRSVRAAMQPLTETVAAPIIQQADNTEKKVQQVEQVLAAKRKQEEEVRKKEEEKARKEAEAKAKEEEKKRKAEEERVKKEEAKRKEEEAKKQKAEEEQARKEEEQKKAEEAKAKKEEEQATAEKAKQERAKMVEEDKTSLDAKKAEEEKRKREEEEKKRKREEEEAKAAAERKQKEEQAAKVAAEEEEKKKKDAAAQKESQDSNASGTCSGGHCPATTVTSSEGEGGKKKQAGLGMALKALYKGEGEQRVQAGFTVSKLLPGGPAAASGKIAVGDIVEEVDGVDVRAMPLKRLASEIIMGEEHTPINLKVITPAGEGKLVTLSRQAS